VQLLPGIGAKGADKLWRKFQDLLPPLSPPADETNDSSEGESDHDATPAPNDASQSESVPSLATILRDCSAAAPKKSARAWTEFVIRVSQIEDSKVRSLPSRMIEIVLEAGYEDYLGETYTNYRSRTEDLEQLAVFARNFANTDDFLSQLSLLTNLEAEDDRTRSDDQEQLRLSTIHQAKGLEFDVVFVIMLCDGLFPSARSLEDLEDEEEERRLFYVAVTRARNELYLSYPLVRLTPGGGDYMQMPSRFLNEIPPELVDEWNLRGY
jgi:DNA helicase-2/ATP-dependent DNA helicase PcrA